MLHMTRLPTFFRDFDELFRDVAAPTPEGPTAPRALIPAADVVETPKAIEIRVDLPGVTPEEIDVKLEGDQLTITAERKQTETTEGKGWLRQERSWGRYTRSFTLPNTLSGTQPEATYKHGVLTLSVPKREEVQPRSLKVKVEA